MAVALKPTSSLYSRNASAEEASTHPQNSFTSLSPSRRQSVRIASQSPTRANNSNNNNINESDSDSGMSSASSPSRRHSLRVQQRLGFDDLTLVPLNEIAMKKDDPKVSLSASNNRPHPTLNVLPTDLRTPSTSLTPSVNGLTLESRERKLEDFVSSSELAEIAKATPLGNFYHPQRQAQQRHSQPPMKNPLQTATAAQISQTLMKSYGNVSAASVASSSTLAASSKPSLPPKTPPKQIIQDEFVETASGTVKVVRTLRNRSIVASPFPLTAERRRRSLAAPSRPKTSNQFFSSLQTAFLTQVRNLHHHLVRHQRNLLLYSIIFVFISASVYHVYDFISTFKLEPAEIDPVNFKVYERLQQETSFENVDQQVSTPPVVDREIQMQNRDQPGVPLQPINEIPHFDQINEKVQKMFAEAQVELRIYLEERLQDVSLFTRDPTGNHHLKPEVYAALLSAIPSGGDSAAMKEYVDCQLQHILKQITQKLDARPSFDPAKIKEVVRGLEARIDQIETRLKDAKKAKDQATAKEKETIIEPKKQVLNLFDYAASAKIIPALTSKKLNTKSWRQHDASMILKSDLSRDAFFSFAGNRGKVALSFSSPIRPTHVTIDYPLNLLSTADKSCAPRDFEIWALPNPRNERDSPRLLGTGTFDASSGQTSQTFALASVPKSPIRHLQLRIRNNHGNDHFTRLYRLRIHQN